MLFPTTDFAIFFALVFLGHWLLNPRPRLWKPFMIGASYVFYSWWSPRFVLLLAGVSLLAQLGALGVHRIRDRKTRRAGLALAIATVLAPLAYFKYYGFFAVNVSNALSTAGIHRTMPLIQVALPVGVSFFTFMAVSYVVDVYHRTIEPSGWVDLFLFLSFFPHLVAGPIVRPSELIPQLELRRDPKHIDVAGASWLIMGGLFKKVVVSSFLASAIVDPVFGDPGRHSAIEVVFAIVGYAVQIYADFSGYTDIAIGVAKLLGFRFPLNFDRPYSAASLQEFWRRWHMTLSRWLRDYLYIPLGGSRKGEGRTYVNIAVTMVLGGLWHGAAWNFVFWGALHGAGQVVGAWKRNHLRPAPATPGRVWRGRAATFALVCIGWVFFRADSMSTAFSMLARLVTGWTTPTALVTPMVVFAVVGMLGLQFVPHGPGELLQNKISDLRPVVMGIGFGLILLLVSSLGPQGVAPFIYFRF